MQIPPTNHPKNNCQSIPTNASMTDLSTVLPDFPTQPYIRLIPSLERNHVTTADLLTLDCIEIAKRAQLPLLDLKRLCNAVLQALQTDLGVLRPKDGLSATTTLRRTGKELLDSWSTISTLDDGLDQALGGGVPTGYITEITGERYCTPHTLSSFIANIFKRCRQDSIPPHPPSRRPTSCTAWSLLQRSLHLDRICPAYNAHYSASLIAFLLPEAVSRQDHLHRDSRSRISGSYPPLPGPRSHQTAWHQTSHTRFGRGKLQG